MKAAGRRTPTKRHRTLIIVSAATIQQLREMAEVVSVPMTRMLEAVLELSLASSWVGRRLSHRVHELVDAERDGSAGPTHRTTMVIGGATMRQLDHLAIEYTVPMTRMLDALLSLGLETKGIARAAFALAPQIESEYRAGIR
jgi:hypothetical protein